MNNMRVKTAKQIVIVMLSLVSLTIQASDLVIDNVAYNVNLENMEATVVAGDYAFRDIIIPETFDYNGRTFKVTKIGSSAFKHQDHITNPPSYVTKLVIPKSVVTIEDDAISGTKYLKTLIIPNSVKKVGDFNYFTAKDSIIIEDGEDKIVLSQYKNSQFAHFSTDYLYIGREISGVVTYYGLVNSGCRVLEYGDNVTTVCNMDYNYGYNHYYFTKRVETIILGKNVSSIFYGSRLETLKEIYCKSQNPRGYEDLYGYFTNKQYMNLKLYVPQGCRQKYLETEGWKKFFIIEEYETINGIETIKEDKDNGRIWSLDGKEIRINDVDYNQLPHGIYIMNGKKVLKN